MITSGRCHGPGCQQEATVEGGFCSESCQARWNRQYDDSAPRQINELRLHSVSFSAHPSPFLTAAVEAAMPEVERQITAAIDQTLADVTRTRITHTPPGPLYEDICRAYERMSDLPTPEPVKLTREQRDALRAASHPSPNFIGYVQDGALGEPTAVPIELVDTVEESTPYQRMYLNEVVSAGERGAEFVQVAPVEPQVERDERWGWLRRALDVLYGRQP